jgi:hypothetical protein
VRRQCRDRDRADFLQRKIEDHEFGDVRQLQHDPVERAQAKRDEIEREVVAQAVDVGVAIPPLAINQRDSAGVARKDGRKLGRQGLVLPVTARSIALRILGGKRNDAVQHGSSQRIFLSVCSDRLFQGSRHLQRQNDKRWIISNMFDNLSRQA